MQRRVRAKRRINLIVLIVMTVVMLATSIISLQASTEVEPEENQYLELRATTITDIEGQGKQLIMELWGNEIDFKGFEVRFKYDGTKLTPSNISTNEETSDETLFFKFEDEFDEALELFTIPYEDDENVIDAIVSFNPPTTESEHIIEKEDDGMVISTTGGVLLGKMSFKMTVDDFDISGFSLVTDTNSPTTGIKINLNITEAFEAQSTFRFTDQTASKDASLSNIVVSSGEVDEEDETNSTYKEYNLTPTFNKETFAYEIELLEYIDTLKIKATTSDENATMKLKVPKRDENNELVYDTDGATIIYEEKDLESDVPLEVVINKLGEPDTKLTINITAEDGKTTSSYEIVIKRPYGVIKGSVEISPTKSKGENIATIRVYNETEVDSVIDWSNVVTGVADTIHNDLLTLESRNQISNNDGTYEIYVIPGTYVILLDKPGYLDHIYRSKTVQNGDVIDLGNKSLYAGDVNKDGNIQLQDLALILNVFGINDTDINYNIKYDFNEDQQIQLQDYTLALNNFEKTRIIE